MSSNDDLPAILVSAVDVATASGIITELISEGVEPSQTNGAGHGEAAPAAPEAEGEGPEARGVAWKIENKYYSATVRLLPAPDRPARPAPPADVQAHIIYLAEDECSDESACSRRAEAAAARLSRGGVRLLGARCASPPRALRAWARAARYELVPLSEPRAPPALDDPAPDDPAPEEVGVGRLREALHAHLWPTLTPRGQERAPLYFADDVSSDDSSSSSWGSWRRAGAGVGGEGEGVGDDEAGAVERAEQFAAALALLPAARAGAAGVAGAAGGDDDDAARRLRAEQLVAAFCRALGRAPPPDQPDQPPQ